MCSMGEATLAALSKRADPVTLCITQRVELSSPRVCGSTRWLRKGFTWIQQPCHAPCSVHQYSCHAPASIRWHCALPQSQHRSGALAPAYDAKRAPMKYVMRV